MSDAPNDLKYVKSHEWIRTEGDLQFTVGITDHAQSLLGDLVFIELPEVGDTFTIGEEVGVVESVKTASDVYTPLSGEIVAINEELADAPESVNHDPYGDGWLFRIKVSEAAELDDLMSADEYSEFCASEDE